MLNGLWIGMMLIGIVWGICTGQIKALNDGFLTGGKEAIELCITMAGVMSIWCGLMEIAQKSGLVERLTHIIHPFIHFLFPGIPRDHPAEALISLNIIANVLGLGWAATPAGLQAMEVLRKRNLDSSAASNEMCTFLILNISSLQLIPINIIAYRSQYGSVNPTVIVGPAILATAVSTVTAIIFCKLMDRSAHL